MEDLRLVNISGSKRGNEYPDEINKLEIHREKRNVSDLHRELSGFKKDYQNRRSLERSESNDLLADSHNILKRWKNYFSQLLDVHRVSDVRGTEIHTAEPLARICT
jgi:hypothetical protein